MPGRKIHSAAEAHKLLNTAARSGLERAVWARQQGIDARSLNAWRLNLERRSRPKGEAGPLRPVELVEQPVVATDPFRVGCGAFIVEVPPSFEDAALARLLKVVSTC